MFNTTQINLEDSGIDLKKLIYVAAPMRYTAIIQYIKQHLDMSQALSIRCICSTYLPNWHPNEDYRTSYSAHKDLGGGVSIDLIHEWDYITYLLGFPQKTYSIIKKYPLLKLTATILLSTSLNMHTKQLSYISITLVVKKHVIWTFFSRMILFIVIS